MTRAAPAVAIANPRTFRSVSGSWISVANTAVAMGIIVGMISALSDAGVRLRPTKARELNPTTPKAAAATTGRQRCTGRGVLVIAHAARSTADAIANRIV